MAFSKIIFNGITQIDLTQDTVVADKLYQSYTAHGADGLPVVGTATGGGSENDYPTFTITFDSNWEEVQSVTCDKTLNECFDIYDLNGGMCPAFVVATDGTEEVKGMAWGYEETSVSMTFALLPDFSADIYYGRHEITTSMPNPSSYPDSVTIRQNGSYDPSDFDYRPIWGITVNVPSGSPNLQDKTVSYTPSETAQSQTITADSGYDGLDEVSVSIGAISSTYVGTGIVRKSSTDLTTSGATVTAPAGYYAEVASKSVSSGSATTPATTVTANPTISIGSSGLITATVNASQAVTPTVSAGYVSTGTSGTITVSGSTTSQLSTVAGSTITPTESQQTAVAASKYTTGAINVAAISSTYIGSEVTRRTSSNLTVSGASVTAPAGYYETAASTSVASGTAGTPTAAKGTVSNHSISVTPSVTNTTGYITGSTKTGTAVTVSASELVSGSETKTANGTYDVTNLASLVVAVPIVTYYTGSSAPSSSLGSNGDIYLQTS